MTFSQRVASRVADVEALDAKLGAVSCAAEGAIEQLNHLQSSSMLVLETVLQAEEIVANLQEALEQQRARRNRLKSQIKQKRALMIVTESEAVADMEMSIGVLREKATKLAYDLLSCDADIVAANQKLSLARVGIPDENTIKGEGVVSESEHAMFENDALFSAVTNIPHRNAVDSFLGAMASGISVFSTQRHIRSLMDASDVQ